MTFSNFFKKIKIHGIGSSILNIILFHNFLVVLTKKKYSLTVTVSVLLENHHQTVTLQDELLATSGKQRSVDVAQVVCPLIQQKFGMVIGSPVSPVVVYMEFLEQHAIATAPVACAPQL